MESGLGSWDNGVLNQLSNAYGSLRPAEQKVAEYVGRNPDDVSHMTISELAEKANTSDATVARFCRQLGYSGFQEFKLTLARSVVSSPQEEIFDRVHKGDPIREIKKKVFTSHIQALQQTLTVLSNSELEKAIGALRVAKRMGFYGFGGSATVAIDAYQKFFKLGVPVEAQVDPHMQRVAASMASRGYVAVAISHSGGTKGLVRVLEVVRSNGGTAVSITQSASSPVAKSSDIRLLTVSAETAFHSESMAARAAQMAILNVLFVAVAMSNYEKTLKNIQAARDLISDQMF